MTRPLTPTGEPQPLEADALRAVSEAVGREAEPTAGASGLVLVDVDPYRLHAYWSLDPAVLAAAYRSFGATAPGHLVLRFREVGEPGRRDAPTPMGPLDVFDREVDGAQGQVEVGVWGRGATWEAELGIAAADGGWLAVARSERVRMPPAGPGPAMSYASINVARLGRDLHPGEQAHGAVVAPEPAAAAPGPEDPSLRNGGPDALEPVFPNPRPQARAPASRAPVGALHPKLHPAPRPREPADDMPARHPPPGYAASPAWSASVGSDLELHAELLVYGRARPGQELVLFGRRIAVEGDGSFRVRQPLSLAAVAPGALATPDDDTPGSG